MKRLLAGLLLLVSCASFAQVFNGAQYYAPLNFGQQFGAITLDLSKSGAFQVTAIGNIQVNGPVGFPVNLASDFTLAVTQGPNGSYTPVFGPGFSVPSNLTFSSTAGATDVLYFHLVNGSAKLVSSSVVANGSGIPGGTTGQLQYKNGSLFGGFTMAGDCTVSVPNITCTKTNGTAFAAVATSGLDSDITLSTPLGGQSFLSGFLAADRSYWTEYTCDVPIVCTFGTNVSTGNQTVEISTSGNFIQTQVIAAGTGTFTTSARTHTVHFRLQAAGGGGGGVASNAAGNGDVAGGGSAGGYCEKTATVTPSTPYTVSLPVGGTGGANTGANGNAPSGDSTVTIGATTYTAKAGNGGIFTATGASLALVSGGANTAVSTNCDVNGAGAPGGWGMILAAGAGGRAGQGGSSAFGAGGATRGTTGAGNPATGPGAGGGGALSGASGAGQTGGAGGDSILIVDEFQ